MNGEGEQFEIKRVEEPKAKIPEEGKIPDEGAKPEAQLSPEVLKLQAEAQQYIDTYKRFFQTFAKDVSLSFKMSDRFYINLENGEVNNDVRWYAEKDCSREQILWANLHELSHFLDLAEDQEGMNKNFDNIFDQAKKTGAMIEKKWQEKFGQTDPEFVEKMKKQQPISPKKPEKTMNASERAAYDIHHTFYNVFDDIYVNNLVARKAPRFEYGQKGAPEDVSNLYKEKLFKGTDYSKSPRHLQFLYNLLREEMVKDEKVQVLEDVKEALDRKIKFMGKEYTPKEIVESFLKPKTGRKTSVTERSLVLRRTLEPVFMDLLKKDFEEWEPEKPKEQKGGGGEGEGGGQGNPFQSDYQEFEDKMPDKIDPEQIKDWVNKDKKEKDEKKAKEEEQKKEDQKSPEQKAKEAQERLDRAWCEKNNIPESVLKKFHRIEANVAPYLEELSQLWRRIIYGSSKIVERGKEGYFKTGTELSIPKVIEEWPKIEKKQFEEVRIFEREIQKEQLVRRPELIRVRLAGDLSGSMDSAKRAVLEKCTVLLLSSLHEFETYLNLSRAQTKSKLEVETEVWVFGDFAKKIKAQRKDLPGVDEQASIVKVYQGLGESLGGTNDNKALEAIEKSITLEEKEQIAKKKIMEIVIEITDGGSSDVGAAKKAVDKLLDEGVIARAFQIGAVSDSEKSDFNKVWNQGREEKCGEIVGTEIGNLIPAVTAVLQKYLGGVRL